MRVGCMVMQLGRHRVQVWRHGASAVTQASAQTFFGRVQSLFGGGGSVQTIPPAWMPSPLIQSPCPSPPRRALPHAHTQPPNTVGRMDHVGTPLFIEAQVQQMAAMEQHAPLLYSSGPQSQGESSSLPHDATQAEVARQLAGMRALMTEAG